MNKEALISELTKILEPYTKDQEALASMHEDTDFINDLKINSAHLVDIVLDVEEAFDIEIENEAMEKMLNVRAALEIIESKIATS